MRTLTDHIVDGDSANHQLTIEVMDAPGQGGASHRYEITGFDTSTNHSDQQDSAQLNAGAQKVTVLFQNGPIKEFGVNGITQEALLAIVMDRLKAFQSGQFSCPDNAAALGHCEHALAYLQKRTLARLARGVEGTHTI